INKCSECSYTTSTSNELQLHIRRVHNKHACLICWRLFGQKANRDRHLCLHTGHKPYKCDICGEKFSRGDKLKIHKKRFH
ncbi:hypothetical protein HELRODRAFT_137145, partial [Helobdella robusta]|uniref:C2H2-type domain-containing protein n=1 Tax=Helobdella robusta TaxID=6412 RepID=T1EIH9_HELRO